MTTRRRYLNYWYQESARPAATPAISAANQAIAAETQAAINTNMSEANWGTMVDRHRMLIDTLNAGLVDIGRLYSDTRAMD